MICFYNAEKLDIIMQPKLDCVGNWCKPWISKLELMLTLICIVILMYLISNQAYYATCSTTEFSWIGCLPHGIMAFLNSSEEGYLSWDMRQLWIQFKIFCFLHDIWQAWEITCWMCLWAKIRHPLFWYNLLWHDVDNLCWIHQLQDWSSTIHHLPNVLERSTCMRQPPKSAGTNIIS